MTPLSNLFRWVVYQQDYFWFLAIIGWTVLGVFWWRFLRPIAAKLWLPWVAGVGIATAAIELSQLLLPITVRPGVAPWQMWDLAVGIANAVLAAGWWLLVWRERSSQRQRALGFFIAAGVTAFAPLRYLYPLAGSWLTTLTLTAAAGVLVHRNREAEKDLTALSLVVAASWCSTTGPLAEVLRIPHRYTEFSLLGPCCAMLQLGAIFFFGRNLAGARSPSVLFAPTAEAKALLRRQVVWLGVGLLLAFGMSWWARVQFERNILARVQMAAELIDRDVLAEGLDARFRLGDVRPFQQQNGDISHEASSAHLGTRILLPVAKTLTKVEIANPDAQWALVQTLRNGWLVACCTSTQMPGEMADVGVYRAVLPQDLIAWSEKRPSVEGPVELYYGAMVQVRAPLLGPDDRMRGWLVLDFTTAHWLAAQIQARLLAFVVIAIGSALLFTDSLRRQREREREEAARQAEVALGANRMKAAFLAKVSHELRTPIQSLLGYSELLRQRMTNDPKAAGWLASLQQHGELMTRLVNDLVDLGAIESGSFRLAARPIDPATLVSQAIESFRPRAEARNLTLACFIDPAVPEALMLDGERFRQVLINLVGNAIKFTDRGGITVALQMDSAGLLALIVRDTGPGIPQVDQAQLFIAFSRLDLTAHKEGTGLGLALSAALCKAMGGRLEVTSDGRTGSCFTASFEACPASVPMLPRAAAPSPTLRGRRILVVDDNSLLRELFIAFLTEQGAMCAAAGSGAQALAQADASGFDAVILDLSLPDGDGTDFVGPLRIRGQDTRIIGVSAHASALDRQRSLAAGMDAFLTKPVALAALAAAVVESPVPEGRNFSTAEGLRERLVRQFVRDLPDLRTRMETAVAAGDWPRVEALAHHLKNSAVVVRDDALFSVCTGLEDAASLEEALSARNWWTLCTPHFQRWLERERSPGLSPATNVAEK